MLKNLFLVILCMCCASCYAEDISSLIVMLKNESIHYYAFTDKPVITFEKENMVIKSDAANAEYRINEIDCYYFGNLDNSAIQSTSLDFYFEIKNKKIVVGGVEYVQLISFDGKVVANKNATNGLVEISMEGLQSNIYIINTNKKSVKVNIK